MKTDSRKVLLEDRLEELGKRSKGAELERALYNPGYVLVKDAVDLALTNLLKDIVHHRTEVFCGGSASILVLI